MLGLTAASVPLYDLYCRVSGYGGTPRIDGDAAAVQPQAERVTVQFNADVDRSLPWSFQPEQRSLNVAVGEQTMAFYVAVNRADHPVVGRAVYNVTPFKIGSYFSKISCFCFDEQTLKPGERVEMPVSFYVDPAMLDRCRHARCPTDHPVLHVFHRSRGDGGAACGSRPPDSSSRDQERGSW